MKLEGLEGKLESLFFLLEENGILSKEDDRMRINFHKERMSFEREDWVREARICLHRISLHF